MDITQHSINAGAGTAQLPSDGENNNGSWFNNSYQWRHQANVRDTPGDRAPRQISLRGDLPNVRTRDRVSTDQSLRGAFLEDDHAAMDAQVAFSRGKPGYEDRLLACQAQAAAYFGRMTAARELSTRAIEAASRTNAPERTAEYRVSAMWREAEVGNASMALTWADASVLKSESPFVQGWGGDLVGSNRR